MPSASEILKTAEQVMSAKGAERDVAQERSMARCVVAFNAITGSHLTERDGWLFMAVLKATRAASTPKGVPDDYVDGAAYFALAGESIGVGCRNQPPT